jgi:hypothetical protein
LACGGSTEPEVPGALRRDVASVEVTPADLTLRVGASGRLTATPRDADGNVVSRAVSWSSGNAAVARVDDSGLVTAVSVGSTTITATVDTRSGSAAVQAVVSAAPSVSINAPGVGTVFEVGTPVLFEGSATDPEDGPIAGAALSWNSNLMGIIGSGTSFTATNLVPGAHFITLTATDSDAEQGTDTLTVVVACVERAIAVGATMNGELIGLDCEAANRPGGHKAHFYSFDGIAGTAVHVSMSSGAFDTYLNVLQPDGVTLAGFNDDCEAPLNLGGSDSCVYDLVILDAGAYTVEATTYDPGAIGNYWVAVDPTFAAHIDMPDAQAGVQTILIGDPEPFRYQCTIGVEVTGYGQAGWNADLAEVFIDYYSQDTDAYLFTDVVQLVDVFGASALAAGERLSGSIEMETSHASQYVPFWAELFFDYDSPDTGETGKEIFREFDCQ